MSGAGLGGWGCRLPTLGTASGTRDLAQVVGTHGDHAGACVAHILRNLTLELTAGKDVPGQVLAVKLEPDRQTLASESSL